MDCLEIPRHDLSSVHGTRRLGMTVLGEAVQMTRARVPDKPLHTPERWAVGGYGAARIRSIGFDYAGGVAETKSLSRMARTTVRWS